MKPFFRVVHAILVIAAVHLAATFAPAQEQWLVQTGDFKSISGAIVGLDETQIRVGDQSIAYDDFLSAMRPGIVARPAGRFMLRLVDGQRMIGEPAQSKDEKLIWKETLIGELAIPLKQVQSITLAGAEMPMLPKPRQDDLVSLANGDSVSGFIAEIANGSIIVRTGGADTTIPLDSVVSIQLAGVGGGKSVSPEQIRLSLLDGSIVAATQLKLTDAKLSFESAGSRRELTLDQLVSIEHVNGPVVWLSNLPAIVNEQVPFFESSWPTNIDRTASGGIIRFRDQTFARGIGVHASSRLVFELPAGARLFRTLYAIDGQRPLANVDVVIKLDDKVIHEAKSFRAGKLTGPIQLDLTGGKQLTLEVGFGLGLDAQDHFVWIEPAVLKSKVVK